MEFNDFEQKITIKSKITQSINNSKTLREIAEGLTDMDYWNDQQQKSSGIPNYETSSNRSDANDRSYDVHILKINKELKLLKKETNNN